MKELMDIIKTLTLDEKKKLHAELAKEIQRDIVTVQETANRLLMYYVNEVCRILGLESYSPDSRERINVISRVIIANLLVQLGYSEVLVGRVMKKNHSTIHIYKKTFKDWMSFPKAYSEELSYWDKVLKTYETNRGTI